MRRHPAGQHILDVPAGNGKLTTCLRNLGHQVTPADINLQQSDFVYADMTRKLPFESETFDGAICLEGIEHVLNPFLLLGELIRVTKIGGHVVVSTPNVMNLYSRLQFLLTGTFYQFHPSQLKDYGPEEAVDRFHISPMTYHQMRYLGDFFGAKVAEVRGDRAKSLWLAPLYAASQFLGWPWARSLFFSAAYKQYLARNTEIYQHINSRPALLGRSLIMVFEKTRATIPLHLEVELAAPNPQQTEPTVQPAPAAQPFTQAA